MIQQHIIIVLISDGKNNTQKIYQKILSEMKNG